MNCTRVVILSLLAALLLGASGAVFAAEDKGFDIAARSDRTDLGFSDSEVDLQMILRNAARRQEPGSV
jgi:hypothetical protein